MEKWIAPKQPLSSNLLLLGIVCVIVSLCIGLFIATWESDSILWGSVEKTIIVFILFSIIFYVHTKTKSPIYSNGIIYLIALVSFLIIFCYPIYSNLQNPLFNPNNIYYQSYDPIVGHWEGFGNSNSYIGFLMLQFIPLGIGIILGVCYAYDLVFRLVYGYNSTIYSIKKRKFYKPIYNKSYNRYVNDELDRLEKYPDFNIFLKVLYDPQRFQDIHKAKKGYFHVYKLNDENELVISLHTGIYKLSQQESSILLKYMS